MGGFAGLDPFELANIKKDRPDLRDGIYAPILRALTRSLDPSPTLRTAMGKIVRNQLQTSQGFQNSCAAQALCGVIDILRIRDGGRAWDTRNPKVSAEMLFKCAREIEAAELGKTQPLEGVQSLRSAIRA